MVKRTEKISEPTFADMFKGDQGGNENVIDMGKVQMFFFTIIIFVAYAGQLLDLIVTNSAIELTSFPQLGEGMITLLGISNAGYLANKNTDKPTNS